MNILSKWISSRAVRILAVVMLLFLGFSMLSRAALMLKSSAEWTLNFDLVKAWVCGVGFDLAAGTFALVFFWPLLLIAALFKKKPLLFRIALCVGLVLFLLGMIWTTTAEWVFWDEFGVRFNFIAVDYLVFTQEVLGNIFESYPMGWIIGGMLLLAALIMWALARFGVLKWVQDGASKLRYSLVTILCHLGILVALGFGVKQSLLPNFSNQYVGELAKNGCWAFVAAYQSMEIDFLKWYPTLQEDEANKITQSLVVTADQKLLNQGNAIAREIVGRGEEKKWNVITICMESMSGSYMKTRGNPGNFTPVLDQLTEKSLYFENLFATGTRTVRGMEAITLCLPPTPGQSILYRPDGINLRTSFGPFLDRNYDCAFLYGGHGKFDYMNRYFSTSGCRISDLGTWNESDLTFRTSWGACDGDLFNKALSEADENFAKNKNFSFFCMTTSNHRPYDFPAGCIDLPSHNRMAAVKYADWAIGDFLEKASHKAWYKDTIFVICSDHCASSAGKSELEVSNYRIPAMIYNPQLITPQKITTMSSQIDVMSTVFGLLNWNYTSLSFGRDMLSPEVKNLKGRAFVSNYQKVALLEDDQLSIIKPTKQHSSYHYEKSTGELTPSTEAAGQSTLQHAIAYYQTAYQLFKRGHLKR